MATKYPIVLVHGIAAKQLRILNAFGKIGNKLEEAGNAKICSFLPLDFFEEW
jgi:hypothetical protein